jgi:hypothetical protein
MNAVCEHSLALVETFPLHLALSPYSINDRRLFGHSGESVVALQGRRSARRNSDVQLV